MYVRKIRWFIPPAEKKHISSFNNALGKYIMNEYFYHPNHQVSRLFGSLVNITWRVWKKKTPEDEQTICTCKYMHICAVWKFRLNFHIPHSINVIYSYWLSVKATLDLLKTQMLPKSESNIFVWRSNKSYVARIPVNNSFMTSFTKDSSIISKVTSSTALSLAISVPPRMWTNIDLLWRSGPTIFMLHRHTDQRHVQFKFVLLDFWFVRTI